MRASFKVAATGAIGDEARALSATMAALPISPLIQTEMIEAIERWREAAAREGRAAAGWAATLEAASDGRVETLLVQVGAERSVWRCPACGRLAAAGGKCPLDGTALEERQDGLDLAVHQTLNHGGSVWAVTHAHDLEPFEGIGALLRY